MNFSDKMHIILGYCSDYNIVDLFSTKFILSKKNPASSTSDYSFTICPNFNYRFVPPGDELYEALENGVSQYPKKEGRFPQVSGMRYGFYPSAPPGQRVDPLTVVVDGHCILPDKVRKEPSVLLLLDYLN